MRAWGYTRTSTAEQLTRPDDDRQRIAAACLAYGYELVNVLVDVDVSGKVPLADRPQGRRVHALIEARGGSGAEADVIVITSMDRLTRSSSDGMALIAQLMPVKGRRHQPVLLVSLDDHIDLAGASGRMFAKLRILFAEHERELVSERTSNALQHKRRTGQAFSREPYGWAQTDDKRLVPVPAEQEVLTRMRQLRSDGLSDNAIAAALNSEGVPTKRNGSWAATTVYRILKHAEEMA
jgi:DNA invertase Pin-like site-specific DNA recombinase